MFLILAFATVAIWAVLAVSCFQCKRRAGAVLLDLGRSRSQIASGMVFTGVLVAINIGIVQSLTGVYSISVLVMLAVMMLSFSICGLIEGCSRLQIREAGIVFCPVFLRWEQIDAYEWGGKRGYSLIFWLQRRWSGKLKWGSIPPVHKDVAERLLAQHLRAGRGHAWWMV